MAYENMTYELILKRMMDRVTTNYPNLDRREGSIIFNGLAQSCTLRTITQLSKASLIPQVEITSSLVVSKWV